MRLAKKLLVGLSSIILLCEAAAPVWAAPVGSDQSLPKLLPPPEAVPVEPLQSRPREGVDNRQLLRRESKPSGPVPNPTRQSQRSLESSRPSIEQSEQYDGYLLGPGDKLTVIDSSFGTDEQPYTSEMTVAPDGTISVYPFGVVRAEGHTLKQLTELLNRKGEALAEVPQIVLILKQPRPVTAYVLGDVLNPGLYSNTQQIIPKEGLDLSIPATLSASSTPPPIADFTILTAIQMAGGLNETADIFRIRLTEKGGKQTTVNLWGLLVEGDTSQDIKLKAGDSIFVPRGGARYDSDLLGWAVRRPRPVRVIGEVNRPGLYYLGPGDDLVTILSKAGGFTTIAKQRHVLLSRLNHDGTVTTRAVNVKGALRNHDKAGRASVVPGDVLVVGASLTRRVAPYVGYIVGISSAFVLLRVLNASLPATFLRNQNDNNNNSTNFGGLGGFGVGLGTGAIFGAGSRPNNPGQVAP